MNIILVTFLRTVFLCGLSIMEQDPSKLENGFFEDFKTSASDFFEYASKGRTTAYKFTFGANEPTLKGQNILLFKLDPRDEAGPGQGPEIISKKTTHFGRYATSLKLPDISKTQPNVGAVVGYFTYDEHEKLGLSEIDFEWLLADPSIIYIGTWTGPVKNSKRIERIINVSTGEILSEEIFGKHTKKPKNIKAIEGYNASKQFYTYGFDWKPNAIKWWMINPITSDTLVLWDYKNTKIGIPQHASKYRLNFWHTDNWAVPTNALSKEPPKQPYELAIDWMSYWPF